MRFTRLIFVLLAMVVAIPNVIACSRDKNKDNIEEGNIKVGAESVGSYIDFLKGKKVGVVANQASLISNTHLVDSLISLGLELRAIYCPEHGFRGEAEAGAIISSSVDNKTSLPIISLYGSNKKPSKEEFKENDIIVFDLQDVGTRFYTYISTLHYVMEACAENGIPLIVLDRPNPNASYIDGPVLRDPSLASFVGMHPVPIVYGMTIGEYARMINGEKWLGTTKNRLSGERGNLVSDLRVIPISNYNHNMAYDLPIAPSPNLSSRLSILCYPSLCWFEGTPVSVGRGTDTPFEIVGFPEYNNKIYSFTPRVIKGVSDNPPYKNIKCYGERDRVRALCVSAKSRSEIDLSILILMYKNYPNKDIFFKPFFDKLAGTKDLKEHIRQNKDEKEIRNLWKKDIEEFKEIRKKYIIYT